MPARRRPTLGFLINSLLDPYQQAIWQSAAAEAERRDADLLCFVAGRFGEGYRNLAHDLIGPENVDALMVVSSVVGANLSAEALAAEYARLGPVPLVSIGMEVPGAASLLVDGAAGVEAAVDHLVEVHGRRRLAFIRGPANHDEAEERYRAFREALGRNRLELDPALVYVGDFDRSSGTRAVHAFCDVRRAPFDAIVAASDYMGIYALRDLQWRGFRVPEDVSVTGFDDIRDAACSEPLFTTVRQPLAELGREAVGRALALLGGHPVPEVSRYPAALVIRESCGCRPAGTGAGAGEARAAAGGGALTEALRQRVRTEERFEILQRMALAGLFHEDIRQILARELPQLGIRRFVLCRYADERRREAVPYFRQGPGGDAGSEAEGAYPSRALVPGGFDPATRQTWIFLPIHAYDRSEHWGFAACALSPVEPVTYETIALQVGTALKVAAMLAREREHAGALEVMVEERTRELRETQVQLLDSARQAGMAEVAVGVLHNVGNLLNSVSVCAEEIRTAGADRRLEALERANALFAAHARDLAAFFASDPRARHLPGYYAQVTEALRADAGRTQREAAELLEKVALIRDSIRALQEYARGHQDLLLQEPTDLAELVESALRVHEPHLARQGVEVHRTLGSSRPLVLQRAKVVHVLVNLVKNAMEAMRATPLGARRLTVELEQDVAGTRVRISDTGEGISREDLPRVFRYGFTTKPDGHGFGLHTCANHMAQLGGTIMVESEGPGRGATFTLVFPPPA